MGVEPRRNPEIVVCTLLEEGEHGYLAARTAAQVIKAYVEKQRRQPTKVAGSRDAQPGNAQPGDAQPTTTRMRVPASGKVEIGAVWSTSGDGDGESEGERGHLHAEHVEAGRPQADHPQGDHLQAGHFLVDVSRKQSPPAVAAPGIN